MKPYVARVRQRIAANAENPVWAKMEARWFALVRDAETRIAVYQGGMASPRQNIQAAEEVVRLAAQVDAREVMVTVAAIFLLQAMDPHKFASDKALDVQLVRRVQGLVASNSTAYRDPSGKARRVYHQLAPRASAVLADWLTDALGVLGPFLARLEQRDQEAKAREREELSEALMALK